MVTTWNPSDNIGLSFTNANLTATNTTGSGVWYTCRAYPSFQAANKVYAEFTATAVGISDSSVYLAIMNPNAALSVPGLFDGNSFGYNENGSATYNGSLTLSPTLASWATGNVICFAVDGTHNKVWVRVNGGNWNNDILANQNPATNTGGIVCAQVFSAGAVFFGTSIHTLNYAITANFDGSFAFSAPAGFAAQPTVLSTAVIGDQAFGQIASLANPGPTVSATPSGVRGTLAVAPLSIGMSSIHTVQASVLGGSFALSLQGFLPGAAGFARSGLSFIKTATTIYNFEGFDHETASGDLLQGMVTSFVNSSGSLSTRTPYGAGKSLVVQVIGTIGATEGFAVYNSGPWSPHIATLGVMTQSSISASTATEVGFAYGASAQVFCRLVGSNILAYRGPTGAPVLLGSVFNVIPATGWFYLELQATIAGGSSGGLTIYVNGVQVAQYSGINTSANGLTVVNGVLLGGKSPVGVSTQFWFDDLYVAVSQVGPVRVATVTPAANGSQIQFIPSGTGANWQQVHELVLDSDASYNVASAFFLIDQFTVTALPASTSTITAFKVTAAARKDATSDIALATLVASAGTTADGVREPLTANYQYLWDIYLVDPKTGVNWTPSGVNAVQIGYKIR